MARTIRILLKLLLPPSLQERIQPTVWEDADAPRPDVVFYTGCNLLKTPHIALLCMDVMDALGITYAVAGGPSYCCGVVHWTAGDMLSGVRMGTNSRSKMEKFNSPILSWCPACYVQHNEVNRLGVAHTDSMASFICFLADRVDQLKPLMTNPIPRRVGLHEHSGVPGVEDAVDQILRAIPGVVVVPLDQPKVGIMCVTIQKSPDYKRKLHQDLLEAAVDAKIDTLVGVYHACHRDLCSHERDWPFQVLNIMELIGEAMGLKREDQFKRLKLMQDVEAILEDRGAAIASQKLDPEEVRWVISDVLREQSFPLVG